MGEFGDKFRIEREKKKISLDDVSRVTKIGTRMLQAIEQEQFEQLPGGVFNKGFIRAYAKHLGLNEEQAVNEYLAYMRQAQIEAQEAWQRTANQQARVPAEKKSAKSDFSEHQEAEELPELQLPRAEHVRSARRNYLRRRDLEIPWRIVAAAAVVIVLATILWIRHRHRAAEAAANSTPPASAPAAQAVATPTAPPSSAASMTNPQQASPKPAATNPAPPSQPAVRASQVKPLPTPPANTSTNPQPASPQAQQSANPEPASQSSTPLHLVVRATETSWVSVTADGENVVAETLIAPAHTSVRANREIVVKVGNAGGVTFLWNGKEVPAQGAESEVKTLVFDAQGMHSLPAAQPPTVN